MATSNLTLRITNKAHEGYRRAGVAFAKGVNDLAAKTFTKDQLAAIEADPRLVLTPMDGAYPEERQEREREEVLDEAPAGEANDPKGSVDGGGVDSALTSEDKPEPVDVPEALRAGFNKLTDLVGSDALELNSSGKPNADALGVNAKQRDEIWALHQQQAAK